MSKRKLNVGLHPYRMKENPEEQRFADAWEARNATLWDPGTVLLDALLSDGVTRVSATPREIEVAATVIQWLGSPVGQCFLRDLGYTKKPTD